MENKQTSQKQGTCRCDFIMRVSIDNYFFPSVNILNFSQQIPILCVDLVFGGLTMAAPMGHLTIKFYSTLSRFTVTRWSYIYWWKWASFSESIEAHFH